MDEQLFKPGDLVWFEPGIGFPLPGEVLEIHEAAQITVIGTSFDGKQQTFTLAKDEGNLAIRENSEIDGVDDLIMLERLHEASVLWNLRIRFLDSKFYTFIGSILVSINPYSLHSNLYGLEMAKKYAGASIGQLPPHIFAVGQAAYSAIVNQKQSQAIIVAGESGSGKTEANKLLVRYLTAIASTGPNHNKITEQILEAGSLLESFGNARTLKNDNSSRFGKYIEIYFKSGVIIGAKVTHYLLEKSRIVTQFQDERNYHIFYELLSGLSESERVKFGLLQADKYFYLNQGNSDCAPNGSCKEWASLQGAMQVLGLTDNERDGIIRILASILHLGNVYFHRKQLHRGVEGVELGSEGAECKWMAHLLEISSEDLIQSLKIRMTETRNDLLCTPLTIDQALDARDALAKTLYSGLFNWLVQRLNSIIHKGGTHDAQRMSILDIYGFESLQENSFEQLCINYANESLQLYFNKNIFKIEQAEYAKERLEWENLEWEDNLPIIHLLAKKPVGIFHLLDDESNFPRASDLSFLEKCHYNHALNEIYKRPRIGANEFGINHYGSGLVWYNVDGFLEKNRDAIRPEVLDILESSSMKIVQDISKQMRAQRDGKFHPRSPNATTRFVTIKPRLSTASARFSDSMQHLLTSMSKCNPWFVRCIKPNQDKQAKKIDMQCVLDQMRFLRILSTVEIRQKGYPVRLRFQHFVERYRHLLHNTPRGTPYRDLCKTVLNTQTLDESQNYQIGATRIFLRETLHRRLEDSRFERLNRAATIIQKKVRKVLSKRKVQRQEDSAIILQKVFRGYRERKRYHELKKGVVTAQALYRGKKTRTEFEKIKQDNTIRETEAEMFHQQQSRKTTAFESRKSINASSLDVPAELAFIFSKMDGLEQKHSDKHLVKVVGTVPGPPFASELPADVDQFAFSKFCSVYCDGVQLYFRREPITKPFLNRTASKDRDFHDAIMIFKLILRWMGDSSLDANKDKILADYIVHKGLSSKNLRDEILVQVANQLHGVDESQASRLWLLMSHCLSSFTPGAALSKYLMRFVKHHAPEEQNEIILKKLLRGNNQVSRNYPPTYLEWRASKQSDIALRLSLPDGSLKTIAIDSWTTCEEAAALSLSMIPGMQTKGWTVVLDGNENEPMNDSLSGLDYVLDLIGEKEMSPSFPSQSNNSRRIMPEIQQSAPKQFKSNGTHKEVEPLIKRPQTRPPAPPQQSKVVSDDGYADHANVDPTNVRRKASIDMLSRSSALNERYFEYEKGRSKSMDDLKHSNSENENVPEVEIITPLNEMGLSGSRLNDRYHSVEQNKPVKQLAPRLQKHVYAGKRLGSVNSYRTDRSELLVRSSAMSDTSETPSLASHVRRIRVPSQASDVDQFLDDLFSPVLDGNLDELSDARSLAASIRGNPTILNEDIDVLRKPEFLCKMIKGGGVDNNNEVVGKNPPDESLEEYINDLFQPIFMNENVCILAEKQDLASTIKGGDEDFAEAGTYQQHAQRAFLESAMEQNIKIQQQLVAQNEALQTLLCQRSPDAKTNVQSPFESRKAQNGSKGVFNYSGVDHIERKESSENHGLFSSPPIPPPMPPALEETDPFQRPFMDPYGRAKTVRIGKWRWPPPDNVDGTDDFIAFKLRQNQRKTTPQSQYQNGSMNQDHDQQDEWDKYHSIENVEKTREKNKSDSALNKITAVNKTQKRSFDLGAERPGPSSVGKLKLSTEMRQRLEKVTAGHSVRSTKSDSVSENPPLKLDESRKLMLEQQLRGNLSVRTQIQKMEASRIQKPFGPLPSIPPPPNSIPPAPPMQQSKENVPSFLSRMERDTFGVKSNYNDTQEKIEVEHLEMVYEVNRRSRSHSRERDNYDESLWDRSEVEGPPSNEEAYKTNIRDKSRKSEISQIERERESLLVYQPKLSEKTKRNSQSDQATFKNHMYSQKEREKKLSTLSQTPRDHFDDGKENIDDYAVNGIPKPVLAPALLKAPSACLTYGTKFPWKLRVKKEVFTPTETIESPIVINFIFAQILADLMGASQRISQAEKKHAFNFFKSHDIDLHSFHLAQIRNVTKRQLIEISRSWPLYFSRFFAVNGSPQYPDVSVLAVNHSGGYLARKESSGMVVVKQLPFEQLMSITVLPRPAALQLSLKNGEHCVLHVPKAAAVHSFLQAFLNEHKMLKAAINGNGKNMISSPTNQGTEVYKISDSEHVMSALEKDVPILRNVKPATIASHQHQESTVFSKEQPSPTQTSVVKHSLLQFALQHFRYDIAGVEESNKSRPEKRASHDRSHAANLVKWQGSLLETPLLKLPMDLNNLALECFECILRYCGDLPPDVNCSEVKCVYTVLMHCHKHLILRDEVYCQLMKQTTANRSSFPDSSQRAWRLLSILAAYFGCSESLKPYLIEHLTSATTDRKGTAAAVCLTNLRKTARCGGRKNVPSVEEVTAVSAGRSARRQIYRLPGGAERVVNTRCSTVVQDVISELCSLLGVESEAEQQEFSLYCIVQGDAFTMPLCSDEYILDVTTELLKTNQPFYLIFCRSIWHFPLKKAPQPTPLYVEVLFNQVAPDYLEGLLLEIPNIGTPSLDYIRDIARIAAILHRAADLNHIPVMKEIKFLLPKPALGLRELKPAQWVNLVQTEFIKVLVMTPLQCKAEFLNVLSAWPLFGSSFFAVKRVYGDDIGGIPDDENGTIARELILALNRRGVLFLDSNTHETLHHWHFIEIISTRKVRSEEALYLDMKVGNLLQQNVIRVQTEQAHEISRIIRQYISMASTKDE